MSSRNRNIIHYPNKKYFNDKYGHAICYGSGDISNEILKVNCKKCISKLKLSGNIR